MRTAWPSWEFWTVGRLITFRMCSKAVLCAVFCPIFSDEAILPLRDLFVQLKCLKKLHSLALVGRRKSGFWIGFYLELWKIFGHSEHLFSMHNARPTKKKPTSFHSTFNTRRVMTTYWWKNQREEIITTFTLHSISEKFQSTSCKLEQNLFVSYKKNYIGTYPPDHG